MTIYLDIDPPRVTAQQKGERVGADGRIHHYTKRRVQEARDLMAVGLMGQAPEEPLEGPVYLSATWVFSRACKPKARPEWKTTRPDTDNMIKLLKDVMTDCGYWRDDAQVCNEVCRKLWASVARPRGIYIEVGRLEDDRNS